MSDVRSGSTLLENILSKSDEILSVGELHNLDSYIHKGEWGEKADWKCSCGSSFEDCVFWTKVFASLKTKGINNIDKTSVIFSKPISELIKKQNLEFEINSENYKTIRLLDNIYTAIFENNDQEVIVDSSKRPIQGLSIYRNINYDVKIIYLKRDVRSVAVSKKKWDKKFYSTSRNIYKILLGIKIYEYLCLKCLRKINKEDKISITYESLSRNPQVIIDLITDKFNLKNFKVPEYMFVENDHTIGGTPNKSIKRKIEYDSVWKKEVSKKPMFNMIGSLLNKI